MYLRPLGPLGAAAFCATVLAGCASQPSNYASNGSRGRFYDSKLGVFASPRLVDDGDPIPRGGGTYLVGRPYTIGGRSFYPTQRPEGYTAVGTASWYGDAFHGRRTANGEIFDKNSISAAHPTLPLPSYVRVTNIGNGRSMIVRVNDRGPYHGGRVMDVSQRVAEALSFKGQGTARIRIDYVGRASLGGSDDAKLMATLREDGVPAQLDGSPGVPTMLADAGTPGAPLPTPVAPRSVVGQLERSPRVEQDSESLSVSEPLPRRRSPAPVPPQRPFEVGPDTATMPRQRAELDQLIREGIPSGRGTPPRVSFALTNRSGPEQADTRKPTPFYRRAATTEFDER